ncbi:MULTISPECIES: PTS sugar transporter subunit IIA [Bacillaceae]|uniref:PTS EIIA type-2 domain-containing protein n=1 Tax=Alkalicoccobacillus plakortidis TaxID=444060 RepID=A0A9D5DNY1_9BACI|nr:MULTISPECIES: PTS sugar transporter subunit IIA [Bacillaceae]KQL56439.1 hypothetical protein AN965_14065 [Alkalicoccobacillus plakortidis]RQW21888.1 PTS sugar transporter subunit IIA [Bacillus sp. C1-1]
MDHLLFDASFVYLNQSIHTKKELLTALGTLMEASRCATSGYTQALLEREKDHPTGIPFQPTGVAIPHSNEAFIVKSKISLVTLRRPIYYEQMGTTNVFIPVSIIFLLGIKNDHAARKTVLTLLEKIQDHHFLSTIRSFSSPYEASRYLNKHVQNL